jgi:hypothetical protein
VIEINVDKYEFGKQSRTTGGMAMKVSENVSRILAVILPMIMVLAPYAVLVCFGTDHHVVINEFYTRHSRGQGNEWVELYNPASSEVDINGWQLWTNMNGTPIPIAKPFSGMLSAYGFASAIVNGRLMADDVGLIILEDASGNEIDRMAYGLNDAPVPTDKRKSVGRCPNGEDDDLDSYDFKVMSATKGSENACINPSNHPPEVIEGQMFSLYKNSPAGTAVGNVLAKDEDGDPLKYRITAGNDNGDFTIDVISGLISVVNPPDYENYSMYTLTVEVFDGFDRGSAGVEVNIYDDGASISGGVFHDFDVDGILDDGEPGLSGVTVTLLADGMFDSLTATTSALGGYIFGGLSTAGTYTVTEIDPAGFVSTNAVPGIGASRVDANRLQIDNITDDDINNKRHFGDCLFLDVEAGPQPYTISGHVLDDANCDGLLDNNEPELAGAVVSLSTAEGGGLTQTTGADGFFLLYAPPVAAVTVTCKHPEGYIPSNAIPGEYGEKVDNETIVLDGTSVDPGHTFANNLFGACVVVGEAIISGTVFDDESGNGVFDGEPGIEGVLITLVAPASGATLTDTTDGNGYYEFSVEPGTNVTISSSGPGGSYYPTTLESLLVSTPTAGDYPNRNFGYSDDVT